MHVRSAKIVLGILGQIGAGKSTCSGILSKLGGTVIDADIISHDILSSSHMQKRLAAIFHLGAFSTEKLARRVFSNSRNLSKLTEILHPLIMSRMKSSIRDAKGKFIVIDAPLLLEKNLDSWCDYLLYVSCNDALRYSRLSKRGLNRREVEKRSRFQLSPMVKISMADYIVNNSGDLKRLGRSLKYIVKEVLNAGKKRINKD